MVPNESAVSVPMTFDLPQELLELLPSDPFEQLDFARKITSIALFTRISALESESSVLRDQLAERELVVDDLRNQIESLNNSLSDVVDKISLADQEKERLVNENATLSEQVKKLNRDVAKLESFKKTLMMSLQDDDGSTARDTASSIVPNHSSLSSQSFAGEDEDTEPPSNASPITSQSSDVQNSYQDEPVTDVSQAASRPPRIPSMLLASQTNTPRLTPPGSPPIHSASASPKKTSKPVSPRRHSIALTTNMSDDRSSVFSSGTASPYSLMPGRTRVDGKEFFRQVRGRLSYEQFSAFLANVKELNSHKQTKEVTLQKADEIFGPENKDLYAIFQGLISRNVH